MEVSCFLENCVILKITYIISMSKALYIYPLSYIAPTEGLFTASANSTCFVFDEQIEVL